MDGGARGGAAGRVPRVLPPLVLAVLFLALCAWSWRRWADPLIDFGVELYLPWRILAGDAPYRDIAYRQGPLSPYWNALWFRLFGVSLRSLVLPNLLLFAGVVGLVYALFARALGRGAATLAGAVLLGVFGFSQYVGIANFNYVTPYHHQQTHGIALSLLAIACAGAGLRSARTAPWAAVGACLGGVFLTKAELFVPAAVAVAAALGLRARAQPGGGWRPARAVACGAALPPLVAFAGLAAQMPAATAASGVLGNWAHLAGAGGGVWSDPFYRRWSGLGAPGANLGAALRGVAGIAAFGAVAWGLEVTLPARRRGLAAAVGAAAAFALVWWLRPFGAVGRALPLTTAAVTAWLFARALRGGSGGGSGGGDALARFGPLALFALFGLGLLGKMLLAARIHQYGFALAMPAGVLLAVALVEGVPLLRGGDGRVARALGLGAVAAALLCHLQISQQHYARKTLQVGAGADALLAPPSRGRPLALTLAELERRMPPGASLLVLPEGAILNYWLRRENPSGVLLFLPTELDAFGGDGVVLERVRRAPPDFVVLANRPFHEFGAGPFGSRPRSGRAVLAWVRAHYRPVFAVGGTPFRDRAPGFVILEPR